MKPEYFDPAYSRSRKKIVQEYRDILREGLPKAEADWNVVWVVSGPEITFEDKPSEGKFNQTRTRFETGINVAKEVTAVRLNKPVDQVTIEDIKSQGPLMYYNGWPEHNDYIAQLVKDGVFEKEYGFAGDRIRITDNRKIVHTGHQFEDFPQDLVAQEGKIVIVSDLYKLPRDKRYLGVPYNKIPKEKAVFYPALPLSLPVKYTLKEIKKIFPYTQQRTLPPETF